MDTSKMELPRDSWPRAMIKTEQSVGFLQASESHATKQKNPTKSFFYHNISERNEVKTTGQFWSGGKMSSLLKVLLCFYPFIPGLVHTSKTIQRKILCKVIWVVDLGVLVIKLRDAQTLCVQGGWKRPHEGL